MNEYADRLMHENRMKNLIVRSRPARSCGRPTDPFRFLRCVSCLQDQVR